jgi:hypothetical protein
VIRHIGILAALKYSCAGKMPALPDFVGVSPTKEVVLGESLKCSGVRPRWGNAATWSPHKEQAGCLRSRRGFIL